MPAHTMHASPIPVKRKMPDAQDLCIHKHPKTNDDVDPYGTVEKMTHRFYFVQSCVRARAMHASHGDKGILYLETHHGSLTEELLRHFPASQLHPCNLDASELTPLKNLHPELRCEHEDIVRVSQQDAWLGVWYDMEESWCTRVRGKWEWNRKKMPKVWDNAPVCAVTLTNARIGFTAEEHATDLSHLLEAVGGDLRQQVVPYVGKGGKQNMVFGLVTFPHPIRGDDDKLSLKPGKRVGVRWGKKRVPYYGYVIDVGHSQARVFYDDDHIYLEDVSTMFVATDRPDLSTRCAALLAEEALGRADGPCEALRSEWEARCGRGNALKVCHDDSMCDAAALIEHPVSP